MKFIAGNDRGQTTFFCLDEVIESGNEVRRIYSLVGNLMMEDYGFRVQFIENGRPTY